MSDHTEDEAFLTGSDGQTLDGHVVADLEGEAEAPIESESDDGEEARDEPGQEGAGSDHDMEDLQDDSIHTFEGHTSGVYSAAWCPARPDLVATGGGDDKAFIWRVGQQAFEETGGAVLELEGHTDTVSSLAFSSDGTLLATGGMDGRVKVWEVASGRCVQTLEGPAEAVEWVRWHPKGNVVLAGAADYSAWMWLAQTGACMQVFSGHRGPVSCGGFTPDGKAVVTGGGEEDASLRVWNPKTGECSLTVQGHPYHEAGVTCLDLHSDSTAAISGSEDGTAKVVNVHTGKVISTLNGHEEGSSVEAVAFSRHLPLAVSAGLDGKLIVWDVATASARATCQHPEGVTRLALHPSQPLVFTGCLDGAVRCWDLRTGECLRAFTGHRDAVQDVAVSHDGNFVISGSEDGTARVFSMQPQ
ncbi:hypothetical protein N2152v2_003487 [Parachlorella kessleri]